VDEKNENGNIENPETRTNEKEKMKFDWVTARSSCALPKIFKDLRLHIEQDVKTRNSLRLKTATYEFAVIESENGFKVVLKSDALNLAVTFTLAEHAILVRDNTGTSMFDITLNFTDKGECKLVVKAGAKNGVGRPDVSIAKIMCGFEIVPRANGAIWHSSEENIAKIPCYNLLFSVA
jgi:hypothetical protein